MTWIEPYRIAALETDVKLAEISNKSVLARLRGLARTGGLWGRCHKKGPAFGRLFMVWNAGMGLDGGFLLDVYYLKKQVKCIGRADANGDYIHDLDWAREPLHMEDVILFPMKVEDQFVTTTENGIRFRIDVKHWLGAWFEGEGSPPPGGASVSSFPTPAGDTPATPPEAT